MTEPSANGGDGGKGRKEPRHDWYERVTLATAIIGVIAITTSTVLTQLSSCDASKQTANAISQLADVAAASQGEVNAISRETAVLGKEANATVNEAQQTALEVSALSNSASAAQGQLDVARDTEVTENEAAIKPLSPDLANPPKTIGATMQPWINFQNIGRRPATDVVLNARDFYVTNNQGIETQIDARKLKIPRNNTCFTPTEPVPLGTVWSGQADHVFATRPIRTDQRFAELGKIYVIQGCFKYVTFNVTRHTAFCYILEGDLTSTPDHWPWGHCVGRSQEYTD